MSLVPSAHRAIGKNIEIFSGKKLRHFIQKPTSEGQNCIRKVLCLEAAALLTFFWFFELIYRWRKWCKYFFIPSSWTGKTTEWLCKPLNSETKYYWQQCAKKLQLGTLIPCLLHQNWLVWCWLGWCHCLPVLWPRRLGDFGSCIWGDRQLCLVKGLSFVLCFTSSVVQFIILTSSWETFVHFKL